jgi:hypothetical protein
MNSFPKWWPNLIKSIYDPYTYEISFINNNNVIYYEQATNIGTDFFKALKVQDDRTGLNHEFLYIRYADIDYLKDKNNDLKIANVVNSTLCFDEPVDWADCIKCKVEQPHRCIITTDSIDRKIKKGSCAICGSFRLLSQNKDISEIKLHFGKHKGKNITEVPASYLVWCLENNVFTGPMTERIKGYLGTVKLGP